MRTFALAALGFVLGAVVRLWLRTLRLVIAEDPALAAVRARPWVLCFHHGRQFPLLGWRRRRPTVVLVSHSRDGTIQSRVMRVLGLSVVRGSSSRGGARGLAGLVRLMRAEHDGAFAVDGPRGPIGEVKEGALLAARATGAVLVPASGASARARVLDRAWDRFLLPLPFSRARVVLGAPIEPTHEDARVMLERALFALNDEADRCVRS